MGKLYEQITPELIDWVGRQHVFFVASAPLSAAGHVNCSPKGLDTLRILDARHVASWVTAISQALSCPENLAPYRGRALERAKLFSWARTARLTRSVYVEALERFGG